MRIKTKSITSENKKIVTSKFQIIWGNYYKFRYLIKLNNRFGSESVVSGEINGKHVIIRAVEHR